MAAIACWFTRNCNRREKLALEYSDFGEECLGTQCAFNK
jgi:hypothetical protein